MESSAASDVYKSQVPVVYSGIGRRSDEFAVVRAGLNYKFGSY